MTMPRNFPLRSIVKPSDLNGVTNGNIPAEFLVDVGRRNSKMHHLAARGWRCLMWHFEQAGFEWDLASIDPRTYQRQCEMFDGRKYTSGRYLPQSMWAAWTAGGGKWGLRDNGTIQQYTWTAQDRTTSEQWRRMAPNAMAAVPGTSPHGWALAVDLATQLDDDAAAESITEDQVRFLMANDLALNCGFAWSTTSEPWHLQWFVGDHVPQFVIDWEQENPVVIDPPPIVPIDGIYPPGSKDVMYPIDYGIAGTDSWWTEMAITPKGLQWSGGPSSESQKIREIFVAVPMPRAPRLKDDADVVNLMRAIGTFGDCPSTFTSNPTLSGSWQANRNPGR